MRAAAVRDPYSIPSEPAGIHISHADCELIADSLRALSAATLNVQGRQMPIARTVYYRRVMEILAKAR